MSSTEVRSQRKAEAIRDAAELIERSKPDTTHLQMALAEPLLPDEDKLAAILFEVTELATRLDRALDHISDHVVAAQQREIKALEPRVASLALEPSSEAAAKEK